MAITYKWEIPQMNAHVEFEGEENVIYTVHYKYLLRHYLLSYPFQKPFDLLSYHLEQALLLNLRKRFGLDQQGVLLYFLYNYFS